MAVFSRYLLSGSTNGLPIKVAATASPGTTIHTSIVSGFDEVYLWASNVTNAAATLTVQWGGTTDPDNDLVTTFSIAANSAPIPIATGQCLSNGVLVKAFSGTANAINITGFVNRIQ